MKSRREMYAEKLQMYYAKENNQIEHSENTIQETSTKLWTKQLEVTQHFTRDFVADVCTEQKGIIGKLVTLIKRIFRKGTYFIFKQFTERAFDFQSRSMELSGEVIKLVLSLEEARIHLEEEQQKLREEQAAFISYMQTQQKLLQEGQQRLEEEQRVLKEKHAELISVAQERIESKLQAQAQVTDLLGKRLDEHFAQISGLQSALHPKVIRETDAKQMAALYAYRYMLGRDPGNTQIEVNAGGENAMEKDIDLRTLDTDDKQMAALYAYRYLLGRDPEDMQIVWNNERSWRELRAEIMESGEYKCEMADIEKCSVKVEGITYFCPPGDKVIPLSMIMLGINWAKDDIDHFISLADQKFYEKAPEEGIFLDIGGNIGTTSIYCKLKLKQRFHFIAFEPVSLNARLLAANAAINGVGSDIEVEQVALSNIMRDHSVMRINKENWGGSAIVNSEADTTLWETEVVSTITLDEYIADHGINAADIKYIWLDVEGHEFEALKGASNLLTGHRIPLCMEFNQRIYKEQGHYEQMLQLLENHYELFIVASMIKTGEESLRPIQELPLVWEEEDGKTCDLILL